MTRSSANTSARFRQRKLSTRQTLQILREDQVEQEDDIAQRNVPKVETGVEKGEEIEHHLQAALSASQAAAVGGKVAQIYIPTPDAIQSSIQYERLYPLTFAQPATYIRFSSTVEDCCGCPYDLDHEDVAFLKPMNKNRNASTQCSEDQFEEVMYFFEETAQTKQPYAVVDSPPVLAYDEMESVFDEDLDDHARPFTEEIYEHWKGRRLNNGNRPLLTSLKLETGADTDDADPYICFRRREVRQIRKTRGRDAHSAEKLKKLRKELEESRQIMALIRQREITKREQLAIERQLFEQRANLRQVKQNLPEQYREGDEDILINQKVRQTRKFIGELSKTDGAKPQKKKPLELTTQRNAGIQLRFAPRPDGKTAETDLVLLQDLLAEQENYLQQEIELKIAQHKKWNEGYVDSTKAPLTPPLEVNMRSSYLNAKIDVPLPTPPASISSEHMGDVTADYNSPSRGNDESITVRYESPSYDEPGQNQPSFRRRYGRGGRLMIDRRGMRLQSTEGLDDTVADRYKFDQDEDEDEIPTYPIDQYDIPRMRYRAHIHAQLQAAKRAQQAQQVEGTASIARRSGSGSVPRQAGSD